MLGNCCWFGLHVVNCFIISLLVYMHVLSRTFILHPCTSGSHTLGMYACTTIAHSGCICYQERTQEHSPHWKNPSADPEKNTKKHIT